MLAYSCGFNEFSQVSSAADDQKRGFVSLPMVIDLQAKIGTREYFVLFVISGRPVSVGCEKKQKNSSKI